MMRLSRSLTTLLSYLALSLLICSAAYAAGQQQPRRSDIAPVERPFGVARRSAPRDERARSLIRRLNLTPDQLARLREIRQQSTLERQTIARSLRRAQRDLDEAIYADAADEQLIETHAKRVAELQAASTRLRAATELRIRRLLTPEQLMEMRALRRRERRRRPAPNLDADTRQQSPRAQTNP